MGIVMIVSFVIPVQPVIRVRGTILSIPTKVPFVKFTISVKARIADKLAPF